jgi:hypothetical protein
MLCNLPVVESPACLGELDLELAARVSRASRQRQSSKLWIVVEPKHCPSGRTFVQRQAAFTDCSFSYITLLSSLSSPSSTLFEQLLDSASCGNPPAPTFLPASAPERHLAFRNTRTPKAEWRNLQRSASSAANRRDQTLLHPSLSLPALHLAHPRQRRLSLLRAVSPPVTGLYFGRHPYIPGKVSPYLNGSRGMLADTTSGKLKQPTRSPSIGSGQAIVAPRLVGSLVESLDAQFLQ